MTREAIPGAEPWKRPLARVAEAHRRADRPRLGGASGLPAPDDRLAEAGWHDLIDEARSGHRRVRRRRAAHFADPGDDADRRRRRSAAGRAGAGRRGRRGAQPSAGSASAARSASTCRPSRGKAQRQAIAEAIDAHPAAAVRAHRGQRLRLPPDRPPAPPRRRCSSSPRDRAAFEARALLRRAARRDAGAKRLAAHPAVIAVLEAQPEWLDALARQVGGAVSLRADPALPMSGGYAEPA